MSITAIRLRAGAAEFATAAAGFSSSVDRWAHLRRDEDALCTCGLTAVGFRHSWAIQHLDACPASALFEADRDG